MTRLHEFGLTAGRLPLGPHNAITDVPGVRVGHHTLHEGAGDHALRTGVTVIVPHDGDLFEDKVAAGTFTINGFGKAVGLEQVRGLGTLESPLALTNTLNVPRVADALVTYMLAQRADIGGRAGSVNVVVGECNDGYLSAIRSRAVTEAHVMAALENATAGPVAEGCVGAGTGTVSFAFKGGMGTASRRVADGRFTLGALVQTNFGMREDLRFLGVPLGRFIGRDYWPAVNTPPVNTPPGSVMIVLATDAPLSAHQLQRVCVRAAFGLGRVGSHASPGSGDFVLAFSTTNRFPHGDDAPAHRQARVHNDQILDEVFLATVESVEEAVLNSLLAATDTTGLHGRTVYALPHAEVERHVVGALGTG